MAAQTISAQELLQEKRDHTPEKYLELEAKANYKSEYDNRIIAPIDFS